MDIQNINAVDNLILEAIRYISKIRKKKVTEDSVSTYLNNKGHITLTISQLLKFWNNYNYNDIINKPISSINRSLPATRMAGINTTPLVSSLHEILPWMLIWISWIKTIYIYIYMYIQTNKNSLTHYYNLIQNSVKTLILVALSLLQTR